MHSNILQGFACVMADLSELHESCSLHLDFILISVLTLEQVLQLSMNVTEHQSLIFTHEVTVYLGHGLTSRVCLRVSQRAMISLASSNCSKKGEGQFTYACRTACKDTVPHAEGPGLNPTLDI